MLLANMESRVETRIDTNLIVELWNNQAELVNSEYDWSKRDALKDTTWTYNAKTGDKLQVFEVAGIIREIEKQQEEEASQIDNV